MRVFAALPLPPAAIGSLTEALQPLRRRYPRLRWVPPGGLHVTLHFFGELPETGVSSLKQVFGDPGLHRSAIPSRFGAFGQFPPGGVPRVLWVGFTLGQPEMAEYWERFESRIASLGWTRDPRGFTPHVTVARNGGRDTVAPGWQEETGVQSPDFLVGECVLYNSILERTGARYIPLTRVEFEGRTP